MKTILNVVESTTDKPARLNLYGFVGQNYWDDEDQSITTQAVSKALETITSSSIDVHIFSNGGDAFEGIGIYNVLKQSDKTINVYIDSLAASAASIIAMAGDTIFMPKNTQLMIHKALTIVYGNVKDLQSAIGMLEKMNDSLKTTYMQRFVGSDEELDQLLDAETFLSADEALSLGLADEIIEDFSFDSIESDTNEDDSDSESNSESVPDSSSESDSDSGSESESESSKDSVEDMIAKYSGKVAAKRDVQAKKGMSIAEKLIKLGEI